MADLSGKTLGSYEIREKLGQGGMSAVYLARQATVGRIVAIKILPILLALDDKYVERFRREVNMIARLEHPRILPVYDYGEHDGLYYIVMRYLKAGTLSDRIRAGKIPLTEIATIIAQIAEGLDHAHKSGVIHRDVKSSNFMLDQNGDIYITDFGLSRMVEDSEHLTGSGIMGTPEYMAPEQGMDGEIDHRIDIYSLGVVVFEMLTGKVPYTGSSGSAIIVKHVNETFPDPSVVNPEVPAAVADVVLKATAKQPDKRYQSCRGFSDALNAAIAGKVKARLRISKQWLIPAAAGGLIFIAALAFAFLGGAAEWLKPAPPASPLPIPIDDGLITCADNTVPRLAIDFQGDRADNIAAFDGATSAITFSGDSAFIGPTPAPAASVQVGLRTGKPLADVDVLVRLRWTSARGALQIATLVDPETQAGYRAGFEPIDLTITDLHRALKIWRGEDTLVSGPVSAQLMDGEFHNLRFTVIDGISTLSVDDNPTLIARDPKPLPAGEVQLIVGGGLILVDMLAVCGS